MPFTLAHPAAAVPLRRYELPLSALVVGSMAPDFPYFLGGATDHHFAHHWPGFLWFCVPAGWIVLWIFHRVLKLPLLTLFPAVHQTKLRVISGRFDFGGCQTWRILAALLISACTHLIWDSFTHASGWPVQHWPLLRVILIERTGSRLFVFKVLQHVSTFLGLGLLAFWYRKWLKTSPISTSNPSPTKPHVLRFMSLAAILIAGFCAYFSTDSFHGIGWIQPFVRVFVVRGVAILLLEMLIFSALWHLQQKPQSAP